jgi:Ran GTPase-activating protein (RanGAP) involved in mRNA processing and transport
MAEYKWYYENVGSDTWNPFNDDYCEILNDFHSRNIKSGILSEDPITKVDMKGLYIYDECHKRIRIKKISYDEKVNTDTTKFLYSEETNWLEYRRYRFYETTLNQLCETNLDGLFKVKFYSRNISYPDISSLEDLKLYLLKKFNTGFENRLISSTTLETLPHLIIKLFLINSYNFFRSGFDSNLLNSSLALISSENPIQFETDRVIFYNVGYLNNETIIKLTKNPKTIFSDFEDDPLFIYDIISVTKDYGKVLYLLNEIEKANCIFEFHFMDNTALQNVISLDKYCEDNIFLISVMSYFNFDKIIKNNNTYKVVLRFCKKEEILLRMNNRFYIHNETKTNYELPFYKKNRNSNTLYVEANLDKNDMKLISEFIYKKRIKLQHISFFKNYNIFGDDCIKYLARILKNNKDLKHICGYGPGINKHRQFPLTAIGVELIYHCLLKNKTLKELDLSNNNIGIEGSYFISLIMRDCRLLTLIYVGYNNIGNEGVKLIAEQLKANYTITELKLRCNNIDDIGLGYICDAIKVNNTLNLLNLEDNFITDEGLRIMADALCENFSLTQVEMDRNIFTGQGISNLVEILSNKELIMKHMRVSIHLSSKFVTNNQTWKINGFRICVVFDNE